MPRRRERSTKKNITKKNPACYVLITCEEPTADGCMNVEMTYEGDALVASYLLKGAQSLIDNEEDEYTTDSQKIHQL